ncbi:N-acetylmuramic acid 6-phosphate etherase [soil metagenome]
MPTSAHSDPNLLGGLPTEQRNLETVNIDRVDTLTMVQLLNAQDATVAGSVERALPDIARAIDAITERMKRSGRLIYVGAGTSGRLGVLDASECPPTFNTDPGLVIGLIAGGDHALRHPVENIEDQPEEGKSSLKAIHLSARDAVVGIAASGRTPFVIGALQYARHVAAVTISLSNVQDSRIAEHADIAIAIVTGPEALTGSTRMKAGTAQKMVLNMLSTGTMIRLGKTYSNLMVDVQPSNEKLRDRAIRIVAEAVEIDHDAASNLLDAAASKVKTAVLMGLLDLDVRDAETRLASADGVIRAALNPDQP